MKMIEPAVWFAAWLAIGAAWIVAMPADARAKGWHYVHAAAPIVPLALYVTAPASLHGAVELFLWSGVLVLVLGMLAWTVGHLMRNHSFMDIAYPIMIAAVAAFALRHSTSGASPHAVTLFVLVALWAVRLVAHAGRTNFRIEQQPYANLRKRYGARWPVWSFFSVYVLQGAILWFWCASIVLAMSAPSGRFTILDACGVALWLAGFLFQAIGDSQLRRFKRDPANAGRLMQQGLWSITRHPNYFGEAVMSWAYLLFALQHPWGWIAIVSPLYVTWFMGFGSAVPGNERHMRKTRAEYDDYARRVPKFWPRLRGVK